MKVAILSDTHLRDGQKLPLAVQDIVDKADWVLHAGDLVSEKPFAGLGGRFVAVRGNCDYGLDLPERVVFPCQNLRVGIVHGYQFRSLDRLCDSFAEDVPLLVFGHSHQPVLTRLGDRVLFNPGSPTQRRSQTRCSVGMLHVEGADFEVEHIYLE